MEGNSTLEEFGKNLACFRFVVLYHQLPAESGRSSHWDLMLQQPLAWGDELLTFGVSVPPEDWGPPTSVQHLPNHRPLYLDYEGPISDNRGSVTRVLEGDIQWLVKTTDMLTLEFQPARIPSDNNAFLVRRVLRIRKNPGKANQNEWEMELQSTDKPWDCDSPAEFDAESVRREPDPPHPPRN